MKMLKDKLIQLNQWCIHKKLKISKFLKIKKKKTFKNLSLVKFNFLFIFMLRCVFCFSDYLCIITRRKRWKLHGKTNIIK